MQKIPDRWRLVPKFTVRCSSLSVRNLQALDNKDLFAAIDESIRLQGELADTARQFLGYLRQNKGQLGATVELSKIARAAFSSAQLTVDMHSALSLKRLVNSQDFRTDSPASSLSKILDKLIVIDQQAMTLAEKSYRQLDDWLESVVGQERFRRSVHPHPFPLAGLSMLRTEPVSILRTQRLETRHKLSLLKLILRMIGRNDSTRALGKLISGRVGDVKTVAQSPSVDERYYILLDRNFVKRVLLRLKFAGARLNLQIDSVPHSIEFFQVVGTALVGKRRGNRFFEGLSAQLLRSYELALEYEATSDIESKRDTFGSLLSELLNIDHRLAAHVFFPHVVPVIIGRSLTRVERLLSLRWSQRSEGSGLVRGSALHSFLLFASQLVWTHFGTQEVWQKLTEDSLAAWLLGLDWLSGQVEISQEIAHGIEDALGLSLNLIESFSELATVRFAELAKSGANFPDAFQAAINYAVEGASVQGAENAQAVYNISDVMLSGTARDFESSNYGIVISDLNVRGSLVERPDELYFGEEVNSVCGILAEHLLTFFDGQKEIDLVYGGLVPSGITQLVIHSIKKALARNSGTLHVKSIRSLTETLRSCLLTAFYPVICRISRTGGQKPKGLWYLLDEEYRTAKNLLVGMQGDLRTVRLYDSYFFLHALARKDEILDRLLSKVPQVVRGSLRVSFRHHQCLTIDDALECFRPIDRKITPRRLVQSLLMVRSLKATHDLASYVYVKGVGKPVLISLDSLSCILLLKNLLKNWKRMGLRTVKISNMDPPPEKLWFHDADGPHTAELRVVMVRQR